MLNDVFKISGDKEAILDFRDLSEAKLKNDSVESFDTKREEVVAAITDRLTDDILESLYKMQVEKSEELKYVL